MSELKIVKGDIIVCTHPKLSQPIEGTIIALTNDPGKMIGLELKEAVGFHSCDGRGKEGYCIWVRPENILTKEEHSKVVQMKENTINNYQEFEELILRRNN